MGKCFITIRVAPKQELPTFEELISGTYQEPDENEIYTTTRTWIGDSIGRAYPVAGVNMLEAFITKHKELYDADRQSLYKTFYIPKKSGGLRRIDAPLPPLMDALTELRHILTIHFKAQYHTAAFAYIKNRSVIDAVKRHQDNNSNWFLKIDFHDFFGSTTPDFMMETLSKIYPFSKLVGCDRETLRVALDLCFLNGGLPQGTPISPMLTNLLMIPFDYLLTKKLNNLDGQRFVYTRYADDIHISSLKDFSPELIIRVVTDILHEVKAPYTFKQEKTHYGSRAGRNWMLGVMLNKDNDITVGYRNKKHFKAMLNNYILDHKNAKASWPLEDIQHMSGLLSYYKMIEPDYFKGLISYINNKYSIDFESTLKADLRVL